MILRNGEGFRNLFRGGYVVDMLANPSRRQHCQRNVALCFFQLGHIAAQKASQLRQIHRLEQVVRHAQGKRLPHILIIAVTGDDDSAVRIPFFCQPDHFQSIHHRHADIRDYDLRPQRFNLVNAVPPVGRFALHNTSVFSPGNLPNQSLADYEFVLHHQYAFHGPIPSLIPSAFSQSQVCHHTMRQ